MKVISVNTGRRQRLDHAKASGETGIYKVPAPEGVRVTQTGLVGDTICDTENHGGVDQAVYVYSRADYEWWEKVGGQTLASGTFGENLTLENWKSETAQIGDRFRIGEVVLEITSPRIPCITLQRRMNDQEFLKKFRDAERPGVYCRVISEGELRAGAEVFYEPYPGETVTALELYRDFFTPNLSERAIRRFLAAPIAVRARVHKENQLQTLLSAAPADKEKPGV